MFICIFNTVNINYSSIKIKINIYLTDFISNRKSTIQKEERLKIKDENRKLLTNFMDRYVNEHENGTIKSKIVNIFYR